MNLIRSNPSIHPSTKSTKPRMGRLPVLLLAAAVLAAAAGVVGAFAVPAAGARRRQQATTMTMMDAGGRQRQPQQTRKDVLIQGLLGVTTGALALGSAPPAHAWCGKPYPSWAYRIPFNDGNFACSISGKKASIFLRVVGKDKGGVPPILLFGTVGLAHDYMETLEALAYGDRQVITFDPVGVGQSSRELPAGLAEADLTEEEALQRWSGMVVEVAKAVVEFLELTGSDFHVFGHGAGAIPALQFAADLADARAGNAPSTAAAAGGAVKSLTLASPFVIGSKALAKAYTTAGQVAPLCVSEAVDGFGKVPALGGVEEAREAAFDGRWVSLPAFDRLAGVPVFISYGSDEGMGDKEAQRVAARVPTGGTQAPVVRRFEGTRLPHVDASEAYADWLDEQLQRSEGKMRPV